MVQKTPTHKLLIYHPNPKIDSVLRTLISLHGYKKIFTEVHKLVLSSEIQNNPDWTDAEVWELYRTAKFVKTFES